MLTLAKDLGFHEPISIERDVVQFELDLSNFDRSIL